MVDSLMNVLRSAAALVLAIGWAACASAQTGLTNPALNQWTSSDMGGGAYYMVVKAGPSGTVIIGSDLSGAYLSTNGGANWSCIGSVQGLTMCHVSAIGFDPNHRNVIVLGGNGGLFRSQTGGRTFSQVRQDGYFTDIAFAKSNSQIAYAAGDPHASQYNRAASQVFKSLDNGRSWAGLTTPSGLKIIKIVVHPFNPNIVYVVSGPQRFATGPQVLYQSLDGGTNWTGFAGSVPNVLDFELDPSDPSRVMYLSSFHFTDDYYRHPRLSTDGLWKSSDGGVSWTQKTATNIWGTVHIKRTQPNVVRVMGDYFVYESTNAGDSWSRKGDQGSWDKAGGFSWFYGSFDPSSHGNDLSNPDRYYWVNSLWAFGTSDGGAHFNALYTKEAPPGSNRWRDTGLKNTCVWQVRLSQADPNVVFAAFWDMGLWRSLDHGETWESCNNLGYSGNWKEPLVKGTPQGIGGNARSIAPDPSRPNVVWATVGGDQNEPLHLLRSANYGRFDSWQVASGLPAT